MYLSMGPCTYISCTEIDLSGWEERLACRAKGKGGSPVLEATPSGTANLH